MILIIDEYCAHWSSKVNLNIVDLILIANDNVVQDVSSQGTSPMIQGYLNLLLSEPILTPEIARLLDL